VDNGGRIDDSYDMKVSPIIRRAASVAALVFAAASAIHAEVTRLPTFPLQPAFGGGGTAFPSLSAWVMIDHVLNQGDTPDSAHCLDTGGL